MLKGEIEVWMVEWEGVEEWIGELGQVNCFLGLFDFFEVDVKGFLFVDIVKQFGVWVFGVSEFENLLFIFFCGFQFKYQFVKCVCVILQLYVIGFRNRFLFFFVGLIGSFCCDYFYQVNGI